MIGGGCTEERLAATAPYQVCKYSPLWRRRGELLVWRNSQRQRLRSQDEFHSDFSSKDLVTPFLIKMLGRMQVLSTNLKCEKHDVQGIHKEEDEGLAALLRSESRSSIGYRTSSDYTSSLNYSDFSANKPSTHSEAECICMVEVRFVLYHRNMNGRTSFHAALQFEKLSITSGSKPTAFIEVCLCSSLWIALVCERNSTYPLKDTDLDKTLAELCGSDVDANTITIIAD
ncbi:hypothetical protein OSTOST_18658, partial [Ostertagia ostertagi]